MCGDPVMAQRGPDVQRGGYDAAAYWSRAGFGEVFTPPGAD